MDIGKELERITRHRSSILGQECALCMTKVESNVALLAGGDWKLGIDTQPIRYHWSRQPGKAVCGQDTI